MDNAELGANLHPSAEQMDIVNNISAGIDTVCDAVAGAGKTTTVLFIAQHNPQKYIMQITYNSALKDEVRDKVVKNNITNLEIHTYHSLGYNYYSETAKDDIGIEEIIGEKLQTSRNLPTVDILIIDEAQDMTPLYYKFIRKFIDDLNCRRPTLLILGDRYQSVYEFKKADARFLTLAPQIWGNNMVRKSMKTSYRITDHIAKFVNNVLLGEDYICAQKTGPKIKYLRTNAFIVAASYIAGDIFKLISNGVIAPEDIFVLCNSVKSSKTPARRLENILVSLNIPCYVPISEDSELQDKVIKGKVVFSSFHQAKGRERALVIIYGFDSGYFEYYCKDKSPHVCPAELYVGVTRAKNWLYLVEHKGNDHLPFLDYKNVLNGKEFIQYIGEPPRKNTRAKGANNRFYSITTPTELVRFLKDDIMSLCSNYANLLFKSVSGPTNIVQIPSTVTNGVLIEEVSDINGVIIPIMWEVKLHGVSETLLHRSITDYIKNNRYDAVIRKYAKELKKPCKNVSEYLYLGNLYLSAVNGLHHKMNQIAKYDWLTDEMVAGCHKNMDIANVGHGLLFEYAIGCYMGNPHQNRVNVFIRDNVAHITKEVQFYGRLDAMDDTTVWEFKCVGEISTEHKLQLIIYAWMWRMYCPDKNDRIFKLMNTRTGEILQLDLDWKIIDQILIALLKNKYSIPNVATDEEFILSINST